jgi:glyoxylase-like metal-dependent hydrolase (beta-lactamase superfamily II)
MEELPGHDVLRIRADNPGMLSLSGTNTWIVGSDGAWIVDPGPRLQPHVQAILAAAEERGGAAGILLTHDHSDHSEAVAEVAEATGAPVYAGRFPADVQVTDDLRIGPFTAVAAPGHAPDHFVFVHDGGVAFTGDVVLGEGSVFVWPDPGALAGYLAVLERLRAMELTVLAPGHGPPVTDPNAKLTEYLDHRRDRERRLIAGLDAGGRSVDELLDEAWPDVPEGLRPAAAVTLAAHLDKLADEGRLPSGVERPTVPRLSN